MKNLSFYKGFVIIEENNVYSVAYSDIDTLASKELAIAAIDNNLAITDTEVSIYRGISISRMWQNAETVERNGKTMVDNGFYYHIPNGLLSGIIYQSIDELKESIDDAVIDKDDFYKTQFPAQFRAFLKKIKA